MSEKSRHTPPNVRIIAKNNQTWSVDWADDPNSYCRAFNARSRELNLGLTATPHFPNKTKSRRWLWCSLFVIGLGVIAFAIKLWLFAPYWIFFSPRRDLVFRYTTRIHFWCNAPPTHFIHFKDNETVTGQLIDPRYDPAGRIQAFGRREDNYTIDYPIKYFQARRNNRSMPTLLPI